MFNLIDRFEIEAIFLKEQNVKFEHLFE